MIHAEQTDWLSDDDMTKYRHIFGVGDRVRLVDGNRAGKITDYRHGRFIVTLDSDPLHVIAAHGHEIEPESWVPAAARHPAGAVRPERSEPTLENGAGLKAALAAGRVTPQDREIVLRCTKAIESGRADAADWLGCDDSEEMTLLKIVASKYEIFSESSDAGRLTKAAGGGSFSVGDKVRQKSGGRVGKVVAVKANGAVVDLIYDDGNEATCVASYLEPAA